MEMLYDKDADMSVLGGKTIAIVGFGSQAAHTGPGNIIEALVGQLIRERVAAQQHQQSCADHAQRQPDDHQIGQQQTRPQAVKGHQSSITSAVPSITSSVG